MRRERVETNQEKQAKYLKYSTSVLIIENVMKLLNIFTQILAGQNGLLIQTGKGTHLFKL